MPQPYSIEPCVGLYSFNKALVEREVNFHRTVIFTAEIDLSEIEALRSSFAEDQKPSYTAFVAKAVSMALIAFPYANRRLFKFPLLPFVSFYQSFSDTDIAIAIERNIEGQNATAYLEVLSDPHAKTLPEIIARLREFHMADLHTSRQWRDFYRLGRWGWLGSLIAALPLYLPGMWKRYRGSAAMISSPAKYGVDGLAAAWPYPLSFSFGLAQKKALVKNDQVVVAPAFTFVMSWDRRIMSGANAARFFAAVCDSLRHPERMLSST